MTSSDNSANTWRRIAEPFHNQAEAYDTWFVDNPVFNLEVATLKSLATEFLEPKLEIGIGPGRFAQQLGIRFGIDPALAPLVRARKRDCQVCQAIGEQLPFGPDLFGTIYLLFTLCFLSDPDKVLQECRRVLRREGHLVLGLIPARSAWGKALADKAGNDHPLYRHARFRTVAETMHLLTQNGFRPVEARSSLLSGPQDPHPVDEQTPVVEEKAGFVVLVARPTCNPPVNSAVTRNTAACR